MTSSALLDTSFLITLVNETRANHEVASSYYRYMLQNRIRMFVSAIAVSEFSVRQPISELPLHNFIFLPFNVTHGIESARLLNALQRDLGDSRAVVRDDVKLLGQGERESIPFVITDDKNTMHKYCERLRTAGIIKLKAVILDAGFDECAFRADGQVGFGFPLSVEA